MKLTKFILPIAAIMLFVSVGADAQICIYKPGEEYRLEDAIQYKGDNVEFIKWCCDELGMCTPGYAARDHYYLTHIAAMYKRDAVLKYLHENHNIPIDEFPAFVKPGESVDYKTPVMMTAVNGDYSGTQYLIDNNVSVTRKDRNNHDAYYFAKESKNTQVISIVRQAWDKATKDSVMNVQKNKQKLIKLLTINDIKDEIKNFQRSIKFNGFFS